MLLQLMRGTALTRILVVPAPNATNLEFVVPADGTGAAIFREWRLRYVPNLLAP